MPVTIRSTRLYQIIEVRSNQPKHAANQGTSYHTLQRLLCIRLREARQPVKIFPIRHDDIER
jgi:hypothetical protein